MFFFDTQKVTWLKILNHQTTHSGRRHQAMTAFVFNDSLKYKTTKINKLPPFIIYKTHIWQLSSLMLGLFVSGKREDGSDGNGGDDDKQTNKTIKRMNKCESKRANERAVRFSSAEFN